MVFPPCDAVSSPNPTNLNPFIPNKHRAASVQRVLVPLTVSVEVPPEDGSFL